MVSIQTYPEQFCCFRLCYNHLQSIREAAWGIVTQQWNSNLPNTPAGPFCLGESEHSLQQEGCPEPEIWRGMLTYVDSLKIFQLSENPAWFRILWSKMLQNQRVLHVSDQIIVNSARPVFQTAWFPRDPRPLEPPSALFPGWFQMGDAPCKGHKMIQIAELDVESEILARAHFSILYRYVWYV